MKQCAICGQPAERGSTCGDCRAAIKRARDETVSQFQPLPALAIGGAGSGAECHQGRPKVARRAPSSREGRSARPITLRAEAIPARSHASPFVWVMVVLMVLVAIFVAAGVINAAFDAARARGAAAPATGTATASSAGEARAPAPMPREAAPGVGTQEAVEARMGTGPGRDAPTGVAAAPPGPRGMPAAHPGAGVGPGPAPSAAASASAAAVPARAGADVTGPGALGSRTRPAGRAMPPVSGGPEHAAPAPVVVEPQPQAVAPARRVGAAPSVPAARPRETPREPARPDRWERMEAAMQVCAGRDFFGRVICEQKVRFEYCDGFWGQKAQCPGSPVNDHGQ